MGGARRIVVRAPGPRGELARERLPEDVRDAIPEAIQLRSRVPFSGELREALDNTVNGTTHVAAGATFWARGLVALRRSWALYGLGINVGSMAASVAGTWSVTINAYANNPEGRYRVLSNTFDPSTLVGDGTTVVAVALVGARVDADIGVKNLGGVPHTFTGLVAGIWGSNTNL